MSIEQTEVLIIGGGLAGITAAIELLESGKKVKIIDRDIEENFGGLAKESFGGMFFVDTPLQRKNGIRDSPELALRDWHAIAEFSEEDHWPKEWARTYVYNCTQHVYHWLRSQGIRYFPVIHWVERGLFKPGNSIPRFHMVWGTGQGLTTGLITQLHQHPNASKNLSLVFGYCVDNLVIKNGTVIGASGTLEKSGKPFEIHAEVTVVATGGIGGSLKKVHENWHQDWGTPPEDMLIGAHEFGDGALHDIVKKNKGVVTHLDWQWLYAAGVKHPRPKKPNHGLSLIPPRSALWLNYQGKRIGPVPLMYSYDTRYLVESIYKQEKKYSWQVMNQKIAVKELAISGSEFNAAIREKNIWGFLKSTLLGNKGLVEDMLTNCEDFVTASSLEELVKKMNQLTGTQDVQEDQLNKSILEYDEQIDRGPKFFNDDQLRRIVHLRNYRGDRVRTCKFQKILDPNAMPLIAIRERIVTRKTLGGIQTDLKCRVLKADSTPIPGLYAIGEAAGFGGGGMHGRGSLEGTFLGGCVLTGRIAAYDIANKELIN